MGDRGRMTVTFDVTEAQAIALRAFFEMWNHLSSAGGSRYVAFFVDGDGNFHPNCQIVMPLGVRRFLDTPEMRALAITDAHEEMKFDFDPVAWEIEEHEEEARRRVEESASGAQTEEESRG